MQENQRTSRIELITLRFKAIEVVRLLSNLSLELQDVLQIVLPQPFSLLHGPFRGASLLRHCQFRLLHLDANGRHWYEFRSGIQELTARLSRIWWDLRERKRERVFFGIKLASSGLREGDASDWFCGLVLPLFLYITIGPGLHFVINRPTYNGLGFPDRVPLPSLFFFFP